MRRGRVPSPALSPLPAAPLAKVPPLYAGALTWLLSPTWDAGILGADEANCGHLSLSAADGQLQSSDTSPSLSPSPSLQPSSQSSSPSPSPSPSSSPSPSHEGTPQSPRHRLAQVLLHTTPLSPSLGGEPPPNTPSPPSGCPGEATGSPALSSSPSSRQDAQEHPEDVDMDT